MTSHHYSPKDKGGTGIYQERQSGCTCGWKGHVWKFSSRCPNPESESYREWSVHVVNEGMKNRD